MLQIAPEAYFKKSLLGDTLLLATYTFDHCQLLSALCQDLKKFL